MTIKSTVKGCSQRGRHRLRRSCWTMGMKAIVVSFCTLAFAPSVRAAEFRCPSGDVACLIRAIDAANDNQEPTNTITLEQGSYTLTEPFPFFFDNNGPTGLPAISSTLTIRGRGSDQTTIERDSRTAGVPPFRIFQISGSGELTLIGLTIAGGKAEKSVGILFSDTGGGIFSDSNKGVNLNDVAVKHNSAEGGGGGIYHSGLGGLTIVHSDIGNNTSGFSGGGIEAIGFTNERMPVTISRSRISFNQAESDGGGLDALFTLLTINDSTIDTNISDGDGGGMFAESFDTTINNSTISDNQAARGGGIFNNAYEMQLINVTVSNNTATGNGGGIFNTVGTTALVRNTLLVNNSGEFFNGDCNRGGPLTSLGYNINSDGSCSLTADGDKSDNPLLGPLLFHGGPTPTRALLPGSPAIDAIPQTACVVTSDQQGVNRPQGERCDIGAFEAPDYGLINEALTETHTSVVIHDSLENPIGTGCPVTGGDGTPVLVIDATFRNQSTTDFTTLVFTVVTLTRGFVLGAVGGSPPGAAGASVDAGRLPPQAAKVVRMSICFGTPPLTFFVNAMGGISP